MEVEPIASGSGSAGVVKRYADNPDKPNEAEKDTYETSKGLKDVLHGIAFQLMLQVLCLKRAISFGWDFHLATEIKEAEKFDDILLGKLLKNEIHYRRYQLKHKQTESKFITKHNLFTKTRGDYYLPKYFESYQLIKNNPLIKKRHTEEQITKIFDEFIICTNIDIDCDVKAKYFENIENVDPILNVGGSRYLIKLNDEIIDEIFPYFDKGISKLLQLAEALIANIKSPSKSAPLLLEYQKFLVTEIIDVNRKTFRNNFKDESDLSPTATEFRKVLLSKYKKIKFTESINFKFQMSDDSNFQEDDFQKNQENYDNLLNRVTKEDLRDFLSKTVIAVNQPNEIKLREIIGKELGKEYELIDSDLVASQVVQKVFNWFKRKKGTWIKSKLGIELFKDVKNKVDSVIMIGASLNKKSLLESYNIEFKPETLITLKETIKNNQVTIIKSDKNPVLGPVKLYKALQDNYKEQDSFIFLKYKNILILKEEVLAAFEKSRKLLIVEFRQDKGEKDVKVVCQEIKKILLKNREKKLILISKSETVLNQLTSIKFNSCSEYATEININEFSEETQTKLLEKTVCFQGSDVSLNELLQLNSDNTEVEWKIMDSLPLDDLICDKNTVQIGVSLSPAVEYYIERGIDCPTIRTQIKYDFENELFQEDLRYDNSTSDEELAKPTHWLKRVESKLLWQHSSCITESLKSYLITDSKPSLLSHCYSSCCSKNFLSVIETHPFILTSDEAGMGKTTFLTHFEYKLKEKYKFHWIYRMNLNDHAKHFRDAGNKNTPCESKWEDILCTKIMQLNPFEECIFKYLLRNDRVVLLMDGFDEINPNHDANVYGMIEELRRTGIHQMWLTTRPHLEKELEKNLNLLPFRLQSFTKNQQLDFLKLYWVAETTSEYTKAATKDKITKLAEHVLKTLSSNIESYDDKEFFGLPLHIKMLAEMHIKAIDKFCSPESSHDMAQIPILFKNRVALFKQFIDMKLKDFHDEKCKPHDDANVASKVRDNSESMSFKEMHEKCSMELLYRNQPEWSEFKKTMEPFPELKDVYRYGIISNFVYGTPRFIHRSYAEYFAAGFIVRKLTGSSNVDWHSFILINVFCVYRSIGVRAFIDALLQEKPMEMQKTIPYNKYSRRMLETCIEIAKKEKNYSILKFHLDIENIIIKDLLEKLNLDATRKDIQTLLLILIEIIEELRKDSSGYLQVEENEESMLRSLWNQGNDPLVSAVEFIENVTQSLFPRDIDFDELRSNRYLFLAVHENHEEAVKLLCSFVKKTPFINARGKFKLLKTPNKHLNGEHTPWHLAAHYGSAQMMQCLWDTVEDDSIYKNILFTKYFDDEHDTDSDTYRKTAWHFAAEKFHVDVLELLWGWLAAICKSVNEPFLHQIWKIGVKNKNFDVIIKVWKYFPFMRHETIEKFTDIKDASRGCLEIKEIIDKCCLQHTIKPR